MVTLEIDAEFCAAHALVIAGRSEPLHGHNFRVTLRVESAPDAADAGLDADGLLCDFHTVQTVLHELIEPLNNSDLTATLRVNPSAENIARHLADEAAARLDETLGPAARVASCTVSEAPGCRATYARRPA